MSFLDDLLDSETLSGVRATALGYAQAANLLISTWYEGDVGEQIFEAVTQTAYHFVRKVAVITRGFISLDTSTDPGDEDPFNSVNASLTPERGFLSFFGENTFGTVRAESTFATGTVTFVNNGTVARTFGPRGLVFTWSGGTPPDPPPTYRNSADPSIYTNQDGTVTVAAGAELDIPVTAEIIGSYSSAPAGTLSLTTTLIGCEATTNAAAILGTDREDAEVFRGRCRQAPARLSFAGPADAIAYLATKTLDGEPLLNEEGGVVNINRAGVSNDSDTGIVNIYLASPSGDVDGPDLEAADYNIRSTSYAVTDCATLNISSAAPVTIHVVGTASIKRRTGLPSEAELIEYIVGTGEVKGTLTTAFELFPIGGVDPEAGVGVIYTRDIQSIAASAYPGLYNVHVTTPAGETTDLDENEVAVLDSDVDDWIIEVV